MVARPILRPGSVVLRRDAHHLQVGTTPGVIVRDDPGVAAVLRRADGVRTADELSRIAVQAGASDGVALVAELVTRGALVVAPVGGRRLRVDLRHDVGGTRFAATFRALMGDTAVLAESPQALVVTVSTGEPARTPFRAMGQHRISHLPVVLVDDQARVGPLVLPGRTPCLDCFDLQRAAGDPAWSALVPQFGASRPARLGTSTHVVGLAAAEAARVVDDLAAPRPSALIGRALLFGPDGVIESPVGFQHRCGCHLLAA